MKKLIYILIAILLCSCAGKKQFTKERSITDSTHTVTQIVPRDTLIKLPSDSIKIELPFFSIREGSPLTYTSQSGNLSARLSRQGQTLKVDCLTEELELQLKLLDKISKTNRVKTITEKVQVIVPERYVPWWVKTLAWIGAIAIVWIGLRIGLKSFKPF